MALSKSIVDSRVRKQIPKLALAQTKKIIKSAFERKKTEMIAEFLNHPVTIEIKGGINAGNISGILNGITNLYSFIGFYESSDPIAPILDALQTTNLKYTSTSSRSINFTVELPKPEEIWKVTPLPYNVGRSWAKSIETGLSGLNYYLKKRQSSRSGLGIQSKKKVRAARFKNTRYISAFLKRYKKEFENLKV